MATLKNLYVDQGSDFSMPFTVSDLAGNPLNLLSYEIVAVMKRSYESNIFTSLTVDVRNPLDGEIVLCVPAQTSLGVRAGRYVYDVLIIDENGKATRVIEGLVTINPAVTKITQNI